jgi:hypothetical protein
MELDRGVAWDVLLQLLLASGLVGYELFLSKDSTADVLLTAWVATAFVQWVSVTKPAEPAPMATSEPRKFLLHRAARAFLVGALLFGDVFCSTSAEWLSAWVAHNPDAERSLRCAGGTVGWLLLALVARHTVFNRRTMGRAQLVAAACGGITLSVGPALALKNDMEGRGLSAGVAALRTAWLLVLSTSFLVDTKPAKSASPVMRVVFWAATIAFFTFTRPSLVLSGASLAVAMVSAIRMQAPLSTLCALTAAGGVLSLDAMQMGVTIVPILLIVTSRFACSRNASFHQLDAPSARVPSTTTATTQQHRHPNDDVF